MTSKKHVNPTADSFRKAWSKFATGVSIITTIQADNRVHGMSANSIASVSLEPLLSLVCIKHNRDTYALIRDSGQFAINILSESQRAISELYAKTAEERKGQSGIRFSFTEKGSAIVDDCLAYLDCHIVAEYKIGDHSIFIGEVDEIGVSSGRPLIFFESTYSRVDSEIL